MYVDDFKLAGPTKNLKIGWDLIRKHIKLEDPKPAERFLGCNHKIVEKEMVKGISPILGSEDKPKTNETIKVRAMVYDMSTFLSSCVDRYLELAKLDEQAPEGCNAIPRRQQNKERD